MTDYMLGLHPLLITKIQTVLAAMLSAGTPMRPCQGVRSDAYQHSLWLIGRSTAFPGRIVTNCDGFTVRSAHQIAKDGLGHAVDCLFEGPDPFGIKNPWGTYGDLVKAQGLQWGGGWHIKDLDHAELP